MQWLHQGFGYWHGNIRWNHIRHNANGESRDIVTAKIIDYAGWEGQYFTFVSKGAFQALKEWIDYRELSGEITDGWKQPAYARLVVYRHCARKGIGNKAK